MIHTENLLPMLTGITVVIFIIVIGMVLIKKSTEPKDFTASKIGKIGATICLLGVIFLFFLSVFSIHEVPIGYIGLDKNGDWYLAGTYNAMPKKITNIPLNGSINLTNTIELQYDLSPEEVIFLNKRGNFPEYLQQEIVVDQEEWNIDLKNVPKGIDPSHLKLVIGFNSFFYTQTPIISVRTLYTSPCIKSLTSFKYQLLCWVLFFSIIKI